MTITRRHFLGRLGLTAAAVVAMPRRGLAQGQTAAGESPRPTMSGPMDGDAYHPVTRPPKPHALPSMSDADRDALEHNLHCQCGCTLDVYTCRTTDFTCPVSPAMHQDVRRLVAGGYTGPEILGAFRDAYGERVLMAPVREGFNWAAYIAPFAALGAGAAVVGVMIHRWRTPELAPAATSEPDRPGTPEELARLDAAIRNDGR